MERERCDDDDASGTDSYLTSHAWSGQSRARHQHPRQVIDHSHLTSHQSDPGPTITIPVA